MPQDGSPPWPGFVDALSTVLMMMVFFTLLMVIVVGTLSYMVAMRNASPTVAETQSTEIVEASQAVSYAEPLTAAERLKNLLTSKAELKEKDLDPAAMTSLVALEKLKMEKQELQRQLQAAQKKAKQQAALKKEDEATQQALEKALARIKELEASRGKDVEIKSGDEVNPPPFITKIVKGLDSKNRIIILYNKLTNTLEEETKKELLAWLAPNKAAIKANGLELTATLNFEGVSSSTANNVSYKRLYGLIKLANEKGGIPKSKIKFRALDNAVAGTNQVVINVGKGR